MTIFRPSNLNKRIVGVTTLSPGNAGQIGPTKTPYLCGGTLRLGNRCCGGSCPGIFKIKESACGVRECCKQITDCIGILICCGPGTAKWFVSTRTSEVNRSFYSLNDAVTLSNSCFGSCGWFVPNSTQISNPAYCCRSFWDCYRNARYWTSTGTNSDVAITLNFGNGSGYSITPRSDGNMIRTLRCTAT